MSDPITRSDIIQRALQVVNFDTAASPSDQFAASPMVQRWADDSAKALYRQLVKARGNEYYSKTVSTPTIPGQQLYDLAADFFEMLTVYISGPTFIGYSTLDEYMARDEARLRTYGLIGMYTPLVSRYRITGVQATLAPANLPRPFLSILPVPKVVFTIGYTYIPTCVTQPDPTKDYIYDGIEGFDEWCVWDMAVKLAGREERDTTFYMTERGRIEKVIQEMAGARNAGEPERVVDVNGQRRFEAARRCGGGKIRWWGY